ncbi:MAG: hypothetical protein J5563_07140 [Clostridia bacterium]|nr:hypothetical protein [Clostridia bacterium]
MSIEKTVKSDRLLKLLTALPTDLEAIEKTLKQEDFKPDEVTRAGFDYAEACFYECLDVLWDHSEEYACSASIPVPGLMSTEMPRIFELLLRYGLDPNAEFDCETVMGQAAMVSNGYVAADTLALLLEHGGDPFLPSDDISLFDELDFNVCFDAFNQVNRMFYDAEVHCWFVLLGYTEGREQAKNHIDVFSERRNDCNYEPFEISDLKQHRNYTFALTNVPNRGENFSLHIIDRRTFWEVARL